MWLFMALHATEIVETEPAFLCARQRSNGLMARLARYGHVGSGQSKPTLFVASESKRRWAKAVNGVAVFTLIGMRSLGKLPLVGVSVAVNASPKSHLVKSVLTLWLMTLLALYVRMLTDQRVFRLPMVIQQECRRYEVLFVVTARAVASRLASFKLAPMRILVALGALSMFDRLPEISSSMTVLAAHFDVLPNQRKVRARVIKTGRHTNDIPARIDVTTRTRLNECSRVRVFMASLTLAESRSRVLDTVS